MVAASETLQPSVEDVVKLAFAVETRFVEILNKWSKTKGETLPIPTYLDKDILRWRMMVVRYRKGDFRHRLSEVKSVKEVAQWTVDKNCELCDQPKKKIEWRGI